MFFRHSLLNLGMVDSEDGAMEQWHGDFLVRIGRRYELWAFFCAPRKPIPLISSSVVA
jgi:hypothetical protein